MLTARLHFLTPIFVLIVCLAGICGAARAQVPSDLSAEDLRANQEIDQKFIDAHRTLDTDMIMNLFSRQPGIFMIGPTGIMYPGRDQIRHSVETFFAKLVTMTGEIDHVTYMREGDGVVAYGQVTYHRQLKGQPPDTRVAVWSDYRCKENGKWVLVFRHVHWPLASNVLPSAEPAAKAQ